MRLLITTYLFFTVLYSLSAQDYWEERFINGQQHKTIARAQLIKANGLLKNQGIVADSMIISLIRMKEDSLLEDSVKVEIVHFLADLACDTCWLYLLSHINDRFNYGGGSGDIDQYNWTACWSVLGTAAHQEDTKWQILSAIFRSFETRIWDDDSLDLLTTVTFNITSRAALVAILEDKSMRCRNSFQPCGREPYLGNVRRFLAELFK